MKTVVVSGGTKGLGKALCFELAARGYHFVSLFHRDDVAADQQREVASARGLPATVLKQDISAAGLGERLLALPEIAAAQRLVVVNNACATFAPRPLHLIPRDELDGLVDSNLRGSFFLVQALLRPLVRTRGTVVNVLSTVVGAGTAGGPAGATTMGAGFSAYALAKYGLLGFTRALAVDYGRQGLRVFSVSPSYMSTPLTDTWHPDLQSAFGAQRERPEDVARVIADLIDDPATKGAGEDHRTAGKGV